MRGRRIGGWLRTLPLALLLAVSACTEDPSTAIAGDSTKQSGSSTTTLTSPDGWQHYTDEVSGFQLAYPSDWEVMSIDQEARDLVAQQVEDAYGQVSQPVIAFAAGRSLGSAMGFAPNVNVGISALQGQPELDSVAAFAEEGVRMMLPSFTATQQTSESVGNREVIILHGFYYLSDLAPGIGDERWWSTQLTTLDGETGWHVTCGTAGFDEAGVREDMETCEMVVRTFALVSPEG